MSRYNQIYSYFPQAAHGGTRRRGASIMLVMLLLPVIFGMAALTIDVGVMYNARADLQNTADAASISAASRLAELFYQDHAVDDARAVAVDVVGKNKVLSRTVTVDPATDVVFGRVVYDEGTKKYEFNPTEVIPNAVRVTVRQSKDSPNGPIPLFFAAIFGIRETNVSATAVAAMVGKRDIAVTIDLSGSMKNDSYLRNYDLTQINIRDIWAALDGPPPARPYIPGADHETEYAFDPGPTIGIMNNWGDPIDPIGYGPSTDPGLWYIPENANCNIAEIQTSLVARGYSAPHINAIMNNGNNWQNRVGVMLGLAQWTPNNAGDSSVSDGELSWIAHPPYHKPAAGDWVDFIDFVSDDRDNHLPIEFRYRFGLKTYVNWVIRMDNFHENDRTATPEQPLTAVKDGVNKMIEMSSDFDQMSLETFGSTGRHEVDLSDNLQLVKDTLYARQAAHFDGSTNMGEGLQKAIQSLTGPDARDEASKVIVLMSDGVSKRGPDPVDVAESAADEGIKIYAVSVGFGADRSTLQAIAEAGNGAEFYAAGTPEQYAAQLQNIFATIGGLGTVQLVE